MALYESLTKSSTPEEIAAAYKEFTGTTGGDTKAAQEAAVGYLTSLGISAPTIESAYKQYTAPAGALTQAAAAAPMYESLTSSSTPQQIAKAYDEFAGTTGGDTKAAQEAAVGYLTNLGISAPTIEQAYGNYLTSNRYEDYLNANPDVMAEFEKFSKQDPGKWTPESYAAYHLTNYGLGEGRTGGDFQSNVDVLTEQILNQGTTSQWQGEGFGSAEANAADMAKILAAHGLTDINQLGVRTVTNPGFTYETESGYEVVPESSTQEYYNKVTGLALGNTYGERQTGNAWGGTYAGEGNTAYRVQYDANGNPIFYTTGASSSDVADLAPLLALASIIPSPIQPFAQAANAVIALDQGNEVGAILNALGAYGSYTGNELTGMTTPGSSTAVSGLDLASDVATLGANPAVGLQNTLANVNLAKTGVGALNALQTGNLAGLANASLSGYTQLGGTLPSGLTTGVQFANLATAIDKGDIAGALNAAGDLSGSKDLKTASVAASVMRAIESGDSNAIINSLINAENAIGKTGSTASTESTSGITNRTYDETILDAGVKAFTDAKAIGASDEDAMAAANAATDSAMIDLANSSSIVSGSSVLAKDTEFGDLQGAIDKNAMDDAVRADKLDLIKNASTFGDAFAQARELLGPGKTFEWNGKQYSTATFAENPELSGNVISGGASTTAGGGRGSYAGYSSVEDAASKANLTTSKASELLNYINTQEETQYDALGNPIGGTAIAGAPDLSTTSGKIANGVANAMNTFFGVVANSPAAAVQAGGNLLSNAGGIVDLVAGKSTDAGNKLRELSGQVDTFVQSISDPKIKTQQAAIGDAVDKAEGIGGKTAALMSAAWDNPLGAANWILTEGFEEVPGVGLALKAGSKLATYGITIANDMMESGGSAYNDTYKAAIQQGMSEQDARAAARNSSLAAMAVTGVTQGVVEGKVISKIAGKETAGEFTEGALQSGATQLALGQDLSLDKMLTQGVIEAAVGKGAQTTAEATTATNSDSDVFSTVAPGSSADTSKTGTGSSAVATDTVSGTNLATDTGSTTLSGSDSAVDASTGSDAGIETTTSVDADTGAETTTSVDSSTGATTQSTTDSNTGVTTSTTTDSSGNVTSTTQSSTDAKTGVKTETTTNSSTGLTTQSTTDANTGVTTSTTTDSNGNVTSTSTTSVNADTGVKTETTTDANTGSTTQTTTDANTGVTTNTSVNTNTGVNTQTTVDSKTGVTTNVTTDSNTNVTTETKTDSNTNTTTIVQTDVDTNTRTTVVVDTNTGDIIEETETTVPDDWTPPVIETKTTDTATTTPTSTTPSTTPTVKASTPQASAPAMLAGAGLGAAGFDWNIDPRFLKSTVTGGAIDPLAAVKQAQAELERDTMMQNIDPRLMQILQDRMGGQPQAGQGALDQAAPEASNERAYYSYGSEDSIDDILGGAAANYKEGGYVAPLMMNSGGSMALPLLAKSGGALGGYQGRENFKDGKHVAGEGDGQSDDIPAWLADGEFVFPADVVSALGNGSTKAGTDKLYEMMHSIRDRARSTGREDLPPPALKSPLDYLKSSKRSK